MLDLLLALPLLTLASYRAWRLVALDTITEPIRSWVIFRDGPFWEWFSALITCPWCAGFHISVLFFVLWAIFPTPTLYVAAPLAISTLVGLLGKLDD